MTRSSNFLQFGVQILSARIASNYFTLANSMHHHFCQMGWFYEEFCTFLQVCITQDWLRHWTLGIFLLVKRFDECYFFLGGKSGEWAVKFPKSRLLVVLENYAGDWYLVRKKICDLPEIKDLEPLHKTQQKYILISNKIALSLCLSISLSHVWLCFLRMSLFWMMGVEKFCTQCTKIQRLQCYLVMK